MEIKLLLLCIFAFSIAASVCLAFGGIEKSQSLQQELWLECSCMHATDRNGTNWGTISLNATTARTAKNDCFLIFVVAANDEIVGFSFNQIQFQGGYLKRAKCPEECACLFTNSEF